MESFGLDRDDILVTEAANNVDDDIANAARMSDLDDDEMPINRNLDEIGEGNNDGDEDANDPDVLKKLKDLSKGAAKKKVMKPQPKLDLERLQTKRGLEALPGVFKDVKFRGKGYEAKDLSLLMGKLEHWAHRLFPKLAFDDFVERLEKLGSKKSVQTCIKRIRLDMNTPRDEEILRGISDDEGEGVGQSKPQKEITDMDAEEAYEEMMREEREMMEKRKAKEEAEAESAIQTPSKDTHALPSQSTPKPSGSDDKISPKSTPNGLTVSQLERIARNRQLALEKRMAKLGRTPTGAKTPGPQTPQRQKPEDAAGKSSQPIGETVTGGDRSMIAKPQAKTDEATASSQEEQASVQELEAMLDEGDDSVNSQSQSLHLKMSETEALSSQMNTRNPGPSSSMDTEDFSLRLTATDSDVAHSKHAKEGSENLDLQMTETEESEKVQKASSGSPKVDTEKQNLLLDGIEESENTNTDNRHLQLKLSISDDEEGMDTD